MEDFVSNENEHNKNLEEILKDIEKKLECSALTGGFDRLMSKVEAIEESQSNIEKKVDNLHNSIYDPDKGLYARIKEVEHEKEMQISELNKKFGEIRVAEEFEEKNKIEKEVSDKASRELLKKTADQLEDLIKWKDLVTSFVKWALGSSIFGAFGKMLYNVVFSH